MRDSRRDWRRKCQQWKWSERQRDKGGHDLASLVHPGLRSGHLHGFCLEPLSKALGQQYVGGAVAGWGGGVGEAVEHQLGGQQEGQLGERDSRRKNILKWNSKRRDSMKRDSNWGDSMSKNRKRRDGRRWDTSSRDSRRRESMSRDSGGKYPTAWSAAKGGTKWGGNTTWSKNCLAQLEPINILENLGAHRFHKLEFLPLLDFLETNNKLVSHFNWRD